MPEVVILPCGAKTIELLKFDAGVWVKLRPLLAFMNRRFLNRLESMTLTKGQVTTLYSFNVSTLSFYLKVEDVLEVFARVGNKPAQKEVGGKNFVGICS